MIIKVKDKKKILAIIIKPDYLKKKGINFFTSHSLSQQVAYMSHEKNHIIKPHIHKKKLKKIYDTNECLIILKGEMRVDFFDLKKKYLKSKILKKNYIILLLSGGHGFKILKNCQFLEVKQGPFKIGKDKERFDFEKK
jgi:cupin fold WbuC family metalloprotein